MLARVRRDGLPDGLAGRRAAHACGTSRNTRNHGCAHNVSSFTLHAVSTALLVKVHRRDVRTEVLSRRSVTHPPQCTANVQGCRCALPGDLTDSARHSRPGRPGVGSKACGVHYSSTPRSQRYWRVAQAPSHQDRVYEHLVAMPVYSSTFARHAMGDHRQIGLRSLRLGNFGQYQNASASCGDGYLRGDPKRPRPQ